MHFLYVLIHQLHFVDPPSTVLILLQHALERFWEPFPSFLARRLSYLFYILRCKGLLISRATNIESAYCFFFLVLELPDGTGSYSCCSVLGLIRVGKKKIAIKVAYHI